MFATSVTYELALGDDDGLFQFMSGTWTQACQPGRGHQDFTPELCI